MGDAEPKDQHISSGVGGEEVVTIVHAYTYYQLQRATQYTHKLNPML